MTMQERLAAAIAGKAAAGGRSGSPVPGGGAGSRTASPAPSSKEKEPEVNGRASGESMRRARSTRGTRDTKDSKESKDTKDEPEPLEPAKETPPAPPTPTPDPTPVSKPDPEPQPESRHSIKSPRQSFESTTGPLENGHDTNSTSREELLYTISQLREDLALCESRRAEESYASSERIDALEEKIRYLARESAEASRRKATSTPSGGLEKRLAEAQEKIALLMEEGEKLSKNELKLQNTIKKLRAKTQEEEKGTAEARRRFEKAEKEAADSKERLRRAQEEAKRDKEKIKGFGKVESELEALWREKESAQSTIVDLKEKLVEATRKVEDAESRVQTEALEKERRTTIELRAQVERVQSEAAMVEERLKSEVRDLKSKMERDAERARTMEQELKGEQMVCTTLTLLAEGTSY